jgi:predicted DNA-binding transcriptional regulator AlpA
MEQRATDKSIFAEDLDNLCLATSGRKLAEREVGGGKRGLRAGVVAGGNENFAGMGSGEGAAMQKRVTAAAIIAAQSPSIFMTASEVARAIRIGRRTVDDLVAAGVIPQPIRLSRKTVRWLRSAVEAIGQVGGAA